MEMNGIKQRFADAMSRLMKELPISRISVTKLTKEAGLSRPTFYRYFSDIYDLIEWMYLKDKAVILNFYDNSGDFETSLYYSLKIMVKNKKLYQRTVAIENGSFFMNCYYSRAVANYKKYVEAKQELSPDMEFKIKFYAAALVQTLFLWIKQGMDMFPEELARQIIKNTPKELIEALKK